MTPTEHQKITTWARNPGAGIDMKLITTGDPRSRDLSDFCDMLAERAPGLNVIREAEPWNAEPPSIWIGDRVCYRAVPLGTELDPFLSALARSADPSGAPPEKTLADRLRKITLPADLTVYVTGQCPFCPAVVRRLTDLALADDRLRIFVVDGGLFPEKARDDGVTAAPTVILDRVFRWTGRIDLPEILDAAADRDPAALGGPTLERMVEEGEAFRLADMMQAAGTIFPNFIPLLLRTDMKVRLGAMAALEIIADHDPALAAEVIPALKAAFPDQTDLVKGDLIYLIGLFGTAGDIPWVTRTGAAAAHPEIREAAAEAAERLRGRSG